MFGVDTPTESVRLRGADWPTASCDEVRSAVNTAVDEAGSSGSAVRSGITTIDFMLEARCAPHCTVLHRDAPRVGALLGLGKT